MPDTQLNGSNEQISIAPGYTIQAPGIIGWIGSIQLSTDGKRTGLGRGNMPNLERALPDAVMEIRQVIEIEIEQDQRVAARSGVRTASDAVTFRTVLSAEDVGQALLITDTTTGESQWIFPRKPISPTPSTHQPIIYQLPLDPSFMEKDGKRGPIIQGMRKIVRVIGWATDALLGPVTETFAELWETAKRRYGLQMFPASDRDKMPWDRLQSGRALLCIHGTFSTIEEGFGGLSADALSALQARYNGRMFGFNHPTMTRTPSENVDYLLGQLELPLDLDIITHSRGGLVGRELLRRLNSIPSLRVGKLILVASPNRGTPLTDGNHWIEMLDRYTTLLALAPDTSTTLTMESILTVVKMIGHAALGKLRGLDAMNPGSSYLHELNHDAPTNIRYFALVAAYQAQKMSLADKAIDQFFGEPNDGVVPTAGGYGVSKDDQGWIIPPEQRRVFTMSDGIHHNTFFKDKRVTDQICTWLDPAF